MGGVPIGGGAAGRRPVDDAHQHARRRRDDRRRSGAWRRRAASSSASPSRARRRRRPAGDRRRLAAARDRRHPLQRLAGAARDRRRRRRGADQPGQHRRRRQGRAGRPPGEGDVARRCGSARTPARCPTTCASSRPTTRGCARRGGARGGAPAGAAGLPRVQDLGQVVVRARDDPGLPPAVRAGALPAAPRRHRGRTGVHRHGQERCRDRLAARRRDRRHAARLADRRPGRGGQGRLGDPALAGPAPPRADDDRLPVVRPHQRRRARPGERRGGAPGRLRRGVRGGRDGLRRERAGRGRATPTSASPAAATPASSTPTARCCARSRSPQLVDELFREVDAWIAAGMQRPRRKTRKLALPVVSWSARRSRRAQYAAKRACFARYASSWESPKANHSPTYRSSIWVRGGDMLEHRLAGRGLTSPCCGIANAPERCVGSTVNMIARRSGSVTLAQ